MSVSSKYSNHVFLWLFKIYIYEISCKDSPDNKALIYNLLCPPVHDSKQNLEAGKYDLPSCLMVLASVIEYLMKIITTN